VNLGDNTTARVRTQTVCSDDFDSVNAGCSGEATIASIGVRTGPTATPSLLVNATVLFAGASALCAPCGTSGDFSAANVTLSGSLVGGTINVNVGAACNTDVGGLGLVVVNEQFCTGETLTVNALHITVPGVLDVIAAHAEAGSTGCPCATC
jgi:hypothetical protein